MSYQFLNEAFSKLKDYKSVSDVAPDFLPRLKIKMKEEMPESLKKAWDLAVFEAEANIQPCPYGGEYFTAGGRGGWFNMLFGQDTTGIGLLSYNRLYPDVMKNQLRSYALARLNIGFMGPDGWVFEDCDRSIELKMDVWTPNSRAFCERYFMSPALNRTGQDVGWIWAAGDLFDVCGDKLDWAWLFGMGELFFDYFYKPLYDEADGLYCGTASFIDAGTPGYPAALGEFRTQEARNNSATRIKPASTNAIYVRSMDVLAHAAEVLGREADAVKWRTRANSLREAIKGNLRFPDGTFAYFKHKDGTLEPRREALGAAYCVLADVVTGDEAVAALALDKLLFDKGGVSLFYPFYEDVKHCYHNNSAWPFASTFYYMACEKATGKSFMEQDAVQLANSIGVPTDKLNRISVGALEDYQTGTFYEFTKWATQKASGANAQSWTIAAFMNLCLRNGWLDTELPRSRFL